MPTTATPRRHALPPLRPQEEFAGTVLPERPLRRWLARFVGCEAGMLLPGRPEGGVPGKPRRTRERAER